MPHLNVGTIGHKRDAALFAKIYSAVANAGSSPEVEIDKTTEESRVQATDRSPYVIKPWMRTWAEHHARSDPKD